MTLKERFDDFWKILFAPMPVKMWNRTSAPAFREFKQKQIKSFFQQELLALAEEVENQNEWNPTLCGNCNLNGKLCKECYANRRAQKASKDTADLIRAKASELV